MNNKIQGFLLIFGAVVLFASISIAQENTNAQFGGFVPKVPENSEINAVIMEQVRGLMRAEPDSKSVIILVARLGKGEVRRELNRRRLSNVSVRFKNALGIPAEKVVSTEGEKVDDYGRVEIYWNGELVTALLAVKNGDIRVTCCEPDVRYYPEKDDYDREQRRKQKRKKRS